MWIMVSRADRDTKSIKKCGAYSGARLPRYRFPVDLCFLDGKKMYFSVNFFLSTISTYIEVPPLICIMFVEVSPPTSNISFIMRESCIEINDMCAGTMYADTLDTQIYL